MKNFIIMLLLLSVIWINIVSLICWVKNPSLSKMEVFLRTPQSIVLNFNVNKGDK